MHSTRLEKLRLSTLLALPSRRLICLRLDLRSSHSASNIWTQTRAAGGRLFIFAFFWQHCIQYVLVLALSGQQPCDMSPPLFAACTGCREVTVLSLNVSGSLCFMLRDGLQSRRSWRGSDGVAALLWDCVGRFAMSIWYLWSEVQALVRARMEGNDFKLLLFPRVSYRFSPLCCLSKSVVTWLAPRDHMSPFLYRCMEEYHLGIHVRMTLTRDKGRDQ